MATEQQNVKQEEKPEHKMPATTKIHSWNMKAGKQKRWQDWDPQGLHPFVAQRQLLKTQILED